MKVMVWVSGQACTYEAPDGTALGDEVEVSYGREFPRLKTGVVVAIGATGWRTEAGYVTDAWHGPCKPAKPTGHSRDVPQGIGAPL